MKAGRPTIKDVAKLAGVSVATVSAVVNEHKKKVPVSKKSREAVQAAIKKLGYRVNNQASTLRMGRSFTIGVVAADLTQPFTVESVSLVEEEANRRNYSFLLSDIQNSKEREKLCLDLFRQKQVEGILFIGVSNSHDENAVLDIVKSGIPIVLTEREAITHDIPCVLVDNIKGAYLATSYLISLGHQNICYIAGPRSNIITHERLKGYHNALVEHGLIQNERVEYAEGMGLKEGYLTVQQILRNRNHPTAFFTFNDMLALGAIRAIYEAGFRIPEDISIIGFDDLPIAEYSHPALTTVRQPRTKMCHIGVEMLLDILEGKYPKGFYAKIVLQPELIVRESTGKI